MAAKYSKVERKVWRDEKFRELSAPPPNARDMWLYLLTCDSQDAFPGLYVLRLAVAADDLQWSVEDVRRVLAEIPSSMVRWDERTSVVWLPNAIRRRVDEVGTNPKNAKGWRNAWDEVPACDLAREAFQVAAAALTEVGGEATGRAFAARPPSWVGEPQLPPLPPSDRRSKGDPSPIDPAVAVAGGEDTRSSSNTRAQARAALDQHDPEGELPDHSQAVETLLLKRQQALQAAAGPDDEPSDLRESIRAATALWRARKGPKGPGLFFTLIAQLAVKRELEKALDEVDPDRAVLRDAAESERRWRADRPPARGGPPAGMASAAKAALEGLKPPTFDEPTRVAKAVA